MSTHPKGRREPVRAKDRAKIISLDGQRRPGKGLSAPKLEDIPAERITVKGPLPTKAAALISLHRCARIYIDRQTSETFSELADAVIIARFLKVW